MPDMQDFLEAMSVKNFLQLASMPKKKNLNPDSLNTLIDYVSEVYTSETGYFVNDLTEEEIADLTAKFLTKVAVLSRYFARFCYNGWQDEINRRYGKHI